MDDSMGLRFPSQYRKIPICYNDDDDEYSLCYTKKYLRNSPAAITPDFYKSTLIMEDKHLDTIPEMESDELIKSSVEDLVHTPSESDDSTGNDNDHFNAESSPKLNLSFPSGTRNKIFDPGIFIEVQSKRFLSPNEFSISFIRDPLSPVFDTLLPFSSENDEKVFNPGSLSLNEEKSPHLLSHRGFNTSKIISDFSKSPMMIYGEDIPILDVPFSILIPP
ncbi:hypothetical protein Tco_1124734 [Tanacetum coccineum]|uniref:Uncharacterized protein n=1 Tax=Tanacetum coccineum TaxID=301880 RepID=A0ABQ5J712_9ASTR